MKLSLLTFVTSLAIASVAAWYSIIGLTAIFSAAVIPIIIMGIVLDIGKLVAASWVYTYCKETAKFLCCIKDNLKASLAIACSIFNSLSV